LIPYLPPPVLRALGQEISSFDLLVVAAVVVGHQLAFRRAARRGFDQDLAWRVVTWTVLLGLVGSHLGAILLYQPRRALEEPLLLLQVWGAMSSTGGVVGGAAGGWWAMRREGLDGPRRLAFLDVIAFAFPFAWIFGRAGCALAHDHLGVASTSWLAVAFPGGGRLDLGLLELLWTLVMAGLWLVLDRRPRPSGFFLAAWLLLYTPVRIALDALRTDDTRLLLGLTGAQLAAAAGLAAGVWLTLRLARGRA
jgi:phosphatidylglycerol:prolipoprotein diacylglycerol transferase